MKFGSRIVFDGFLGVRPVFMDDVIAMMCFTAAALLFGLPFWLAPIVGIATWWALT